MRVCAVCAGVRVRFDDRSRRRRESLSALGAAWDAEVNLFDIARSYGYGEAANLLGEFLSARRADAVMVPKFGLWSGRPPRSRAALKPALRAGVQLLAKARPLVRTSASGDRTAEQFAVPWLRASL